MKRAILGLCLCAGAMLIGGCAHAGEWSVRSAELNNDLSVGGHFDTAVYAVEDMQTLHVMLIDGPIDAPHQVVHLQMFWRPMGGATPFDASATNATIRYIVFDGDQVGCYGGGGLLRPRDKPGDAQFSGWLRNATIRLMSATDGFENKLGVAVASGSFTAVRDDEKTLALVRQMQTLMQQKLGYPKLVMAQ